MKTINVICTLNLTEDEYSRLLNPETSSSVLSLVYGIIEDGELDRIAFSCPLIPIPLPK